MGEITESLSNQCIIQPNESLRENTWTKKKTPEKAQRTHTSEGSGV